MPLYEYEGQSCGAQFEQLIFNRDTTVTCQSCGGERVVRRLSTFAIGSAGTRSVAAVEPGPCGACGAPQRGTCEMN
jgi:putative FmdB family regulatory protein